MKKTLLTLLFALASLSFAQDSTPTDVTTNDGTVTIASKGSDVRSVLFDLFTQSKTNFVLEPNIHFILYLSLAGVEFEEALNIVCNTSSLEYQIENGIYFIGKKKTPIVPLPKPQAATPAPAKQAPRGKLTAADLDKRLTTRFSKTPITQVFESMTAQTGIEIIVDKGVPAYQLDAFLIETSLQYALDVVCRSTGLTYSLTDDRQIKISKK